MFRGVEVRMPAPADDRSPAIWRQLKSVFAVNILPATELWSFRVENETIKIKYQGFDHIQILTHAILLASTWNSEGVPFYSVWKWSFQTLKG